MRTFPLGGDILRISHNNPSIWSPDGELRPQYYGDTGAGLDLDAVIWLEVVDGIQRWLGSAEIRAAMPISCMTGSGLWSDPLSCEWSGALGTLHLVGDTTVSDGASSGKWSELWLPFSKIITQLSPALLSQPCGRNTHRYGSLCLIWKFMHVYVSPLSKLKQTYNLICSTVWDLNDEHTHLPPTNTKPTHLCQVQRSLQFTSVNVHLYHHIC